MAVQTRFMESARAMNLMLEGLWKEVEDSIDEVQKQVLTDLGKDLCRFLELFEESL